jgi:enoyl-CoA hydratase/carnithine racemase
VTDHLKIERHGRVTVLTMNRPERRNALTLALAADMGEAVAEFDRDADQRVLIVTGAGDQAFCSGADLREMQDELSTMTPVTPEQDISGVAACRKPVIAAINGLAVGGGLEIALCSDIRLAAEHAWFALPEVERGFIAGIAAVTLPRLMPLGAVMEMMLVGERMSAAEAFRLGLVQHVLPKEELMAEAFRLAERMSHHSQAALAGTKKVIRYWRDQALEEHHRFYQATGQEVVDSGDLLEGLRAFQEKRKPNF